MMILYFILLVISITKLEACEELPACRCYVDYISCINNIVDQISFVGKISQITSNITKKFTDLKPIFLQNQWSNGTMVQWSDHKHFTIFKAFSVF